MEIYRWKVSAMLDCWGANSNWSFWSNLNFAWEDSRSLYSSKSPKGRCIICMCPFSQAVVLFYWQYINRPANSNWSFLSNFNFAWEAALILDSQTLIVSLWIPSQNPKFWKQMCRVDGRLHQGMVWWSGVQEASGFMLRSVWVDKCENNQRLGELLTNTILCTRLWPTNPWWRQSIYPPSAPTTMPPLWTNELQTSLQMSLRLCSLERWTNTPNWVKSISTLRLIEAEFQKS